MKKKDSEKEKTKDELFANGQHKLNRSIDQQENKTEDDANRLTENQWE